MPIPLILEGLLFYLMFCGIAAFFGRRRRIGFWGFFFLSIIVTPLLTSLFIFAASPVRRHRVAQKRP
jgi:hypothetical protein